MLIGESKKLRVRVCLPRNCYEVRKARMSVLVRNCHDNTLTGFSSERLEPLQGMNGLPDTPELLSLYRKSVAAVKNRQS